MTNALEAKLGMYDALRQFKNENATTVASLPALQRAFDDFITAHDEVRALLIAESASTRPATAAKRVAREQMEKETAAFAGALFAWADSAGQEVLKTQAHLSRSAIKRLSDEAVSVTARRISALALAQLSALGDYGIDAARHAAFLNIIEDYEALAQSPKAAIAKRIAAKTEIRNLVQRCDALLKNRLDKIVDLLRDASPLFVFGYKANRRIYHKPSHETTLIVEVQNPAGEKISGVTVTLPEFDRSLTTRSDGLAVFKPVSIGEFHISATKSGYKTALLPEARTRPGKSITFIVQMEAAA